MGVSLAVRLCAACYHSTPVTRRPEAHHVRCPESFVDTWWIRLAPNGIQMHKGHLNSRRSGQVLLQTARASSLTLPQVGTQAAYCATTTVKTRRQVFCGASGLSTGPGGTATGCGHGSPPRGHRSSRRRERRREHASCRARSRAPQPAARQSARHGRHSLRVLPALLARSRPEAYRRAP